MNRCTTTLKQGLAQGLMLGLALAGALAMSGCRAETTDNPPRQFFPDLDDQLRYDAQSESAFFADGRTQRMPPANTVAFGRTEHTGEITGVTRAGRTVSADFAKRADLLRDDDRFYRGRNADGSLVEDIPVPVTEELILLGQEQFNIFCIVCHGGLGAGDGMVGQRWSYIIPSFHEAEIQKGGSPEEGRDGYIFDRIRNGVPNPSGAYEHLMPPYASKVNELESWAIVAYIRTLQEARRGGLEDLPDRMRLQLDRSASSGERPTAPNTTEASS